MLRWFKKDPLLIIPFRTYGTSNHIYLKGRAIEDEGIDLNKKNWLNVLVNSWKRFETDEIRKTNLIFKLPGQLRLESKTDAEGYYLIDNATQSLSSYTDAEGWLSYNVSYADSKLRKIQCNNRFTGEMLVPDNSADFGIISDIDDTILHTGVTSKLKWRVIANTLFKTPHKRKALEGTAEFYRALHLGPKANNKNPVFYVSNSPWNLYRYLAFFLKTNHFPKGPILLRDFRMFFDRTPRTERAHKYHEIDNILLHYPHLNFILIGDCGEKDPDIYLDIVKAYPGRVAAIYLRSVNHKRKMKRIASKFQNYSDVPFLIVEKSRDAMIHAKQHGFLA